MVKLLFCRNADQRRFSTLRADINFWSSRAFHDNFTYLVSLTSLLRRTSKITRFQCFGLSGTLYRLRRIVLSRPSRLIRGNGPPAHPCRSAHSRFPPLMGWTGCSPHGVSFGATTSRSSPMTHTHQRPAEDIAVVGVDIGKDVFHLVGFDSRGKIAFRRKIKRPPVNRRANLTPDRRPKLTPLAA